MNKILFTLGLCSILLLYTHCADKNSEEGKILVEIPDANFKSYLIEQFDKNKDGEISRAEAGAAKKISCAGLNIESLIGIAYFSNIKSLDCSNNQLDEIDLRFNRKLNALNCKGNNNPLNVYIGMTSPLRNPEVQRPKDNVQPDVQKVQNPIVKKKCTYDEGTTLFWVYFDY